MLEEITLINEHAPLPAFTWTGIPKFAIITGANGSGKSRLLELINNTTETQNQQNGTISFKPSIPSKNTVKLLRPSFLDGGMQPANLQGRTEKANLVYHYIQSGQYRDEDTRKACQEIIQIIKTKTGFDDQQMKSLSIQKIEQYLPDTYAQIFDSNVAVNHSDLASIFMDYFWKRNELFGQDKKSEVIDIIGEAPWDILNRLLTKYDIKYQFSKPSQPSSQYSCQLLDATTNAELGYGNLSTGEKMMASLLIWAFRKNLNKSVELLLLDEPDAHLHPSMIKMFIEIVDDVLVKEFGIQVIMTTHNPSTVALAEDKNLFFMEKHKGIRPCSKTEALEALTENLFIVRPNTKLILVEGETDVKPYEAILEIIAREHRLKSGFFFKTVGKKSDGGGKIAVIKLATHLTEISWAVSGIVDQDGTTEQLPTNVKRLKRYSIENYVYDPIIIFGCLLNNGYASAVEYANQLGLHQGDSSKISALDVSALNGIASFVYKELYGVDATEYFDVQFEDFVVKYPKAFILDKGKELKSKCISKFNSSVMRSEECLKMMRTIKLMPSDLVELFKTL